MCFTCRLCSQEVDHFLLEVLLEGLLFLKNSTVVHVIMTPGTPPPQILAWKGRRLGGEGREAVRVHEAPSAERRAQLLVVHLGAVRLQLRRRCHGGPSHLR